ncbi:TM2 domain-containing protein [Thalassotalea psychrophila]|uniref:TM2 domain-containing protein n=1 Tax=Thalassotalea psychrophila TaxID=3065647 RepID=A0ABY9TVG4_9GAMM|nr:TM2 domain-containing protein [Colwelliaceae bacterium SQ149]
MNISELEKEEDNLRKEVTALSPEQRRKYYEIEGSKLKDPDTYAALNWFFIAGLHHFYLKKHVKGSIVIILSIYAIFTLFDYGWILLLVLSLIELPQLFFSQRIVKKYNNKVIKQTLIDVIKENSVRQN